jgi:signal transduction histidine kinase
MSAHGEPAQAGDAAMPNVRRHQSAAPVFSAIAVAAMVVASITFGRSAGLVAPLWGGGGLAVVLWLRTTRGRMYDFSFGALLAVGVAVGNLLVGNTTTMTVVFTLANMLEVVLAVVLARQFAPGLSLSTVAGCTRFLTTALIAPIPSALLVSLILWKTAGTDPLLSAQTWWFGHALGIAVIGCFGLALTRPAMERLKRPAVAAEAFVLLSGLTVAAYILFIQLNGRLALLVLPLLLLITVRIRTVGLTAALVIVTMLMVGGSLKGGGVGELALAERAMLAQLLVLLGYMPLVLVAALLEERDVLAVRARQGRIRAERTSAAKSRLLANVAHEIKSPIGGIIGIGDLWRTGQLGPLTTTQTEMADMLVKTARQVETLAYDLLDVARTESGDVKVELRPTDVSGVLEDVKRATALRPEAQNVRLELVTEGEDLVAQADSQRLAQVVSNLASNAVKYGGSGGVVVFKAFRVQDRIRLEVTDRGPGLSPEKQAQLFEPFNRLGLERSGLEGHGIGLALAKRLVELQGGVIGVVSQSGEGATFWVELPMS